MNGDRIKMSDFERVFFLAEDVFAAIDRCHLRKKSRDIVDKKISAFHRAVTALPVERRKKRTEWFGALKTIINQLRRHTK